LHCVEHVLRASGVHIIVRLPRTLDRDGSQMHHGVAALHGAPQCHVIAHIADVQIDRQLRQTFSGMGWRSYESTDA
jgi:hypothetical protein